MRQLGQLETDVMDLLWSNENGLTVHQVRDALERPLAYTTVMTVLDNLFGKDLVTRRKQSRAFVYLPTSTREEHAARLIDSALGVTTDRNAALLHFVGTTLSPAERAELRAALTELDDPADPADLGAH